MSSTARPHHDEDEGVCIYLDGLSGHLHGNPATAEQDQRIRTWLRNNGYEVIEIAVSDLHDEAAMARHFRKLAGYLGANDLRDSLRTDTSWFERARTPKRSAERVRAAARAAAAEERYVELRAAGAAQGAAGAFGDPQNVQDGEWDWVADRHAPSTAAGNVRGAGRRASRWSRRFRTARTASSQHRSPGTRQGRTVLVQLRDAADPETGERYTVKRYESEKVDVGRRNLAPREDHPEAEQSRLSGDRADLRGRERRSGGRRDAGGASADLAPAHVRRRDSGLEPRSIRSPFTRSRCVARAVDPTVAGAAFAMQGGPHGSAAGKSLA